MDMFSTLSASAEGHLMEMVEARDCWLYAWWTTAPDGDRWLSVYRSEYEVERLSWYAEVTRLLDGLTLVSSTVEPHDEMMMGGSPRLAIYR